MLTQRLTLQLCTNCGCHGRGTCGRVIGRDGSVWPARDTGFRMPEHYRVATRRYIGANARAASGHAERHS